MQTLKSSSSLSKIEPLNNYALYLKEFSNLQQLGSKVDIVLVVQ